MVSFRCETRAAKMAFKFIVFASVCAFVRASGIGHAIPAAIAVGSHDSISTYSTVQHHAAPAVHAYAAAPVAYAAPAVAKIAAPVAYAAPAVAPVAYAAPVAKAVVAEPSAPAHYDFGYAVSDPHTGDAKSQQESRRGDVVHGSYSLLDSDGTKRTVDYSADSLHGFNAVVRKEPAVVAAPVVAKVAAPVVAKVAAPVAYAAPAAYAAPSAYAAPAAYAAHVAPGAYAAHVAPAAYAAQVAPAAYSAHVAPAAYTAHIAPAAYAAHAAPVAYAARAAWAAPAW